MQSRCLGGTLLKKIKEEEKTQRHFLINESDLRDMQSRADLIPGGSAMCSTKYAEKIKSQT